jgi:MFS family permease
LGFAHGRSRPGAVPGQLIPGQDRPDGHLPFWRDAQRPADLAVGDAGDAGHVPQFRCQDVRRLVAAGDPLQRQQGLSPLATGLAFLPVTVLIVASNLIAGRILPARGTRAVAWAGALLMGAGCLAMLGLLAARADPLIAGLSLTGFGIGLVVTAITSALLGSVAPAQSGIASGTFTAFRQTGSVLGVALFGTLLASLQPSTGLEVTFAIGAGLVAVVAALGHAAP